MEASVTERQNLPWYRRLHWQILIAMALGIVAGLIFGEAIVPKVGWIGTVFVRLLRMVIVPLIFFSIVSGVAAVGGGRDLGRLFGKTLGYYVLTSGLAALTGLVMVNLIRPGVGAQLGSAARATMPEDLASAGPLELLLDIVPPNIVQAMAGGDMLAVIFFSIVLGMAIATLPAEPQQRLLDFFDAGFQAIMKLTTGIIALLPIGVFGMISKVVGETGTSSFENLALYMLTIASGLAIHLFLTLPLMLKLLGGIRPMVHFRNMAEPLIMAFSTSSSAATLPVTLTAVEKKVRVSNKISSFVLPMGATVNMDGTALYECAGVIFIAQVLGIELTIVQQLVVVGTALLASIGAAAVPSAGLVIIFIVLDAVNLRGPEVDALVLTMLAIDRPLDMARTSVNVYSDSCGAAIIARSEGETLVDAEVVV